MLKKILYGLKQAPRAWYSRLDQHLLQRGFHRGNVGSNLSFKSIGDQVFVVVVYVVDIISSGNDEVCKDFANQMQSTFEMSMIGELTYFFRLQVSQLDAGIFLSD